MKRLGLLFVVSSGLLSGMERDGAFAQFKEFMQARQQVKVSRSTQTAQSDPLFEDWRHSQQQEALRKQNEQKKVPSQEKKSAH